MNEEFCPICPNHCSKDNLGFGRGREYFNNLNAEVLRKKPQDEVINDLRKCGHMLHHMKTINSQKLLSNFNEEELNILHELLSKINSK